jgi:integrase
VWAVDLQFDATTDRRLIKFASVVDEHTRERLGGLVARSITTDTLITALDRVATVRGYGGERYQDSDLVFTRPDGTAFHPERFSSWFRQHVWAAGLPRIRLHDVRHSYSTAALAAGVPAKVVSERLGHAAIAIHDGHLLACPARPGRAGGWSGRSPHPRRRRFGGWSVSKP